IKALETEGCVNGGMIAASSSRHIAPTPRLTAFGASLVAVAAAVPVGVILWTVEAALRWF
ncbi:MAG: hypothetical protein ABR504_04935, partial [Paracoccaceae bacterium]